MNLFNNNNNIIDNTYCKKVKTKITPILDKIGKDLTLIALEEKIDPIVGRSKEIERLYQIINKRKKNNSLIIGEPGVGKSALVEALALKIVQAKFYSNLYGKRIIMLDPINLVAGTKYRGQFEERLKLIIEELKNSNIIIFFDEIHNLIGIGNNSGSLDASNILKPALSRGDIQCIGATTLNEYKKYIEKDGAFNRRFQKIIINPTTELETIEILNKIKHKYQHYHNVIYTESAIKACVYLSSRYLNNRYLPDKAIDTLDETGSHNNIKNIELPLNIISIENNLKKIRIEKSIFIKNHKYEKAIIINNKEKFLEKKLLKEKFFWKKSINKNKKILSENNVAEVISIMSGIPIKNLIVNNFKKLSSINKLIKKKIIGQNLAIEKITKVIHRNKIRLINTNKPIASFIFIGSIGVGKSKLAKILAKEIFNLENSLIKININEYLENFSPLLGISNKYHEYHQSEKLTEKIRKNPYCVILIDKIEKISSEIKNFLIQILKKGKIIDNLGYEINFKNTIIIMTSNKGINNTKDLNIGFNTKNKMKNKLSINKSINYFYSSELLNSVDEIICFSYLKKKNLNHILDIELKSMIKRAYELKYKLKVPKYVRKFIVNISFSKKYGAKTLKKAIEKFIEIPLIEYIIDNKLDQSNKINYLILNLNKRKNNTFINPIK